MPSLRSKPWASVSGILIACALSLFAGGCRKRSVQAAAPVVVAPTPADTQPPANPPVETPPPARGTQPTAPATPPAKPVPKPAPRNAPGASQPPPENPEPEHAARPPAPQISPQLSPADQAALEKKTNANVASAEKNLQQAYGRELNSGQHDLVEKINSFLGQAREATRAADWVRANNLAEKAYLLSVELVNSF
jgi:hypothetical protein